MKTNFSNVQFVRVLDPKETHDPNYVAIQLVAEEVIKNSTTLLLDGEGLKKKRYAIVTVNKQVFTRLNLNPGDNFTEALASLGGDFTAIFGQGARISQKEIVASEYVKLSESNQKSYQVKQIPAKEGKSPIKILSKYGNEPIYMKFVFTPLSDVNCEDLIIPSFLQTVNTEVPVSADSAVIA